VVTCEKPEGQADEPFCHTQTAVAMGTQIPPAHVPAVVVAAHPCAYSAKLAAPVGVAAGDEHAAPCAIVGLPTMEGTSLLVHIESERFIIMLPPLQLNVPP
jgi:hypothetical protein